MATYKKVLVTGIEAPNGVVMVKDSNGKYVKDSLVVATTSTAVTASDTCYFKMDAQDWRFVILVTTTLADTSITFKAGDNEVWAGEDLTLSLPLASTEYAITIESGRFKNVKNKELTSGVTNMDTVVFTLNKASSVKVVRLPH